MNILPMRTTVDAETGEIKEEATFDDFWTLFPKRVAKKDASRAWIRLTPYQRVAALVALVDWRRVWAMKDTQYIPHAASWLNGERFEDELPPEYTQTSASHRPAEIRDHERGAIPEHVKALLARLKGAK